jgi:hypothetical protein
MSVAGDLPSVLATGNGRVPVEQRLPWQAWGMGKRRVSARPGLGG